METCKWFAYGECHLDPPKFVQTQSDCENCGCPQIGGYSFPKVSINSFCSHHTILESKND